MTDFLFSTVVDDPGKTSKVNARDWSVLWPFLVVFLLMWLVILPHYHRLISQSLTSFLITSASSCTIASVLFSTFQSHLISLNKYCWPRFLSRSQSAMRTVRVWLRVSAEDWPGFCICVVVNRFPARNNTNFSISVVQKLHQVNSQIVDFYNNSLCHVFSTVFDKPRKLVESILLINCRSLLSSAEIAER